MWPARGTAAEGDEARPAPGRSATVGLKGAAARGLLEAVADAGGRMPLEIPLGILVARPPGR